MNFRRAFGAGALGAVVMSFLMAVGRYAGMTELNLEMGLGSMITMTINSGTWVVGLVVHLIAGGIVGLIYAAVFEHVARGATAGLGGAFGAIHSAISGVLLMMMPAVHPLMSTTPGVGQLQAPGPFGISYGLATAAAFVILHIIYGAIVGGAYVVRPKHRVMEIPRAA